MGSQVDFSSLLDLLLPIGLVRSQMFSTQIFSRNFILFLNKGFPWTKSSLTKICLDQKFIGPSFFVYKKISSDTNFFGTPQDLSSRIFHVNQNFSQIKDFFTLNCSSFYETKKKILAKLFGQKSLLFKHLIFNQML